MLFVGILTLSCENETEEITKTEVNDIKNAYIEITTTLPIGAEMKFMGMRISRFKDVPVWIDWNSDGKQDEVYEKDIPISNNIFAFKTIGNQTFRIYGIKSISISKGFVKKLETSHNPFLKSIRYYAKQVSVIGGTIDGDDLISFDISKNPNLESISIKGANKLTSLDVSHNYKLKYLECSGKKITKLDISKNPDLEELNCEKCNLTYLDISKNNKLENLNCSYNKLISLDVSKNNKLSRLSCEDNKLTSLNTAQNPNLIELSFYDNKITKMDISKNNKLTHCFFSGNPLTCIKINDLQVTRFNDDIFKVDCE